VTCFSFGQDTIVMLLWILQGVDSVEWIICQCEYLTDIQTTADGWRGKQESEETGHS
jgi:hypothetical protein